MLQGAPRVAPDLGEVALLDGAILLEHRRPVRPLMFQRGTRGVGIVERRGRAQAHGDTGAHHVRILDLGDPAAQ